MGPVHHGQAASVEHAEVPDQRLETRHVAGRDDDDRGRQARAVGEHDLTAVDRLHGRDRFDLAGADGLDDSHVLHRDPAHEHAGVEVGAGARHPVGAEVGLLHHGEHLGDPVDQPRGQAAHQDAGRLRRPAHPRARQDVRRGADAEPDLGGAVLGQVGGDLHAGVAGSDDEHVTPGVRAAVAVVAGHHDLAGEVGQAGPVRLDRGVVVAGGHHDVVGGDVAAVVQAHRPAGVGPAGACVAPLDGRDPGPQAQLEPVVGGVRLEVADHVVPRHPATCAAGDRVARQARPAAGGVQVEAVVVAAPRAADLWRAVDDHRVDPVRLECGSNREAPGSGSDDDNLDSSHAAKAIHPGWVRGCDRRSARENGLVGGARNPVGQ